MSEEILKALTQLFAIITKQDEGVTDVERAFVIDFFKQRLSKDSVDEYLQLYEEFLTEKQRKRPERLSRNKPGEENSDRPERKERIARSAKLTSMKDSVRTLAICKKINKTLTQKQKVIVIIELLELVNSDKNFTSQRREILNTVSTVFNIDTDEYKVIENFVLSETEENLNADQVLIASETKPEGDKINHIPSEGLRGSIFFLHVKSVDLYFAKYIGEDELILNSQVVYQNQIYLYSSGSILKPPTSHPIYYADLVAQYNHDDSGSTVSFNCKDVEYKFSNGAIGLRNVNITESRGQLIGIMGASGAGKTTLLNVLAGIETPSQGEVLINGIDIHQQRDKIKGVIGYIAQDDILIEDLTVYENLFFNARLCFKNKSDEALKELVLDVLISLGLEHIKSLKVGNVLNKKISGGQRKRLNIALELIREPAVMFVDEPTSGLSSRDSENVIDLLKELSLKGKLIFVVIHQPSSEIYKMFDKMFIMDTGGFPIYYGSPVEAVVHFKTATNQINSERGQCHECGNVNPEQVFDIIEARVVNEYGQETGKRKSTPEQWHDLYKETHIIKHVADFDEAPPNALNIPSKLKQWLIFTLRDIKSKVSNKQYMLINLLQAPVLAFILAFIIRYDNTPDGEGYLFRYNENIPAFLLMSIIVALFMGLTVSAEEIIRDRKIEKREKFLSLSRSSYLFSKLGILFLLSAIQSALFVAVGNPILEIQGMFFPYWLILFSTSCFANVLGLNISASFNSAVTVYIIIPLILIPQMILSGALFNFEKLHDSVAAKGHTPIIADIMASRWAYEGLAVKQFKESEYEALYFEVDMQKSDIHYYEAYMIPEINKLLNSCELYTHQGADSLGDKIMHNFEYIVDGLAQLKAKVPYIEYGFEIDENTAYSIDLHKKIKAYLILVGEQFNEAFNKFVSKRDDITLMLKQLYAEHGKTLATIKNETFNERIDEVVTNINTDHRILQHDGKLIRQIDPIFNNPRPSGILDYRSPLYAPEKHFLGQYMDTFTFNVLVIWMMTLLLYLFLYFEFFRRFINLFDNLKLNRDSNS